jgi:hypothetical protein
MNEEPVSQADLELFYSKVDGAFKSHQRFFQEELDLFGKKLDALEQQVATITVGFAEQAVLVEALISQLEFETEERQLAFKDKVLSTRDLMLETLEYTADVLEDGDTGTEQPLEDVATED